MQNKLTNQWVLDYLKKMNKDQLNQEFNYKEILPAFCRTILKPGKWS